MATLALWLVTATAQAAPAPWYFWRSTVNGQRVCVQTSPGHGWTRDSEAWAGPGCQQRPPVVVVPWRQQRSPAR